MIFRVFFCAIPALFGSVIFWVLDPWIGLLSLCAGFAVGWSITRPIKEREELE